MIYLYIFAFVVLAGAFFDDDDTFLGDLIYAVGALLLVAVPLGLVGAIILWKASNPEVPPLAWSLCGLAVLGVIGYLFERAERTKDD